MNEYISSAAGHYICGLAFEQNDHVLRVNLSGKGTVLYLGTPPTADEQGTDNQQKATIEHWKSRAGLKHTFLDSSLLAYATTTTRAATTPDNTSRLSGLQLLRPFRNGYLFAAQHHGGNESSHYILGHAKSLQSTQSNSNDIAQSLATIEPKSVTILARLESFLSAWDYTLSNDVINESGGIGLWENMPSAHEHHPSFALSGDGTTLVLAERDKKAMRPTPLTQLFVYRLPNQARLLRTLLRAEEKRCQEERRQEAEEDGSERARRAKFLDRLEGREAAETTPPSTRQRHTVGRLPVCLSTIQGTVTEMTFEDLTVDSGQKACALRVITAAATKSWRLTEM